ncbi:hypothetical protein AURDEDRAFT_128295 [Auricularia subglabra TFB-10046 SS5]|nr:hypothetical protein AURDEDRAFT_128295 [Auricularia subglabra TFB-10046 SS5]
MERFSWFLIGLFIPKLLLTRAIGEYFAAKRLLREAEKKQPDPPALLSRGNLWNRPWRDLSHKPWTMTHSFYAVMGGLVVKSPDGLRALTPDEVLEHWDSIPSLAADDIQDRSKAGLIAKALFCWQLVAFTVSCIARLTEHLALSLLEITTLAHCLCALLSIVCWWHKPHGVSECVIIEFRVTNTTEVVTSDGPSSDAAEPGTVNEHSPADIMDEQSPDALTSMLAHNPPTEPSLGAEEPTGVLVHTPLVTPSEPPRGAADPSTVVEDTPVTPPIGPSPDATEKHPVLKQVFSLPISLTLLALYGLPHLLGLRVEFPTLAERRCWIIATSTIIGGLPLALVHETYVGLMRSGNGQSPDSRSCWDYLMGCIGIAYMLACCFILCESVRQLFVLPSATFVSPDLVCYLPNFS